MNFQQSEQEVLLEETEATFSQLSQQSLLSLTIDEFYGKNGRSLGSMSMDEFIASIWNTDGIQVNPPPVATYDEAARNKSVAPEPIILPPAPFSVPSPICKKTVDEVWSEIHKSQPIYNEGNSLGRNETLQKQPTLGEMTLEEFLVKAGVVRESSSLFNTLPPPQNPFGNIATNVPLGASYILIGTTGSSVSGGGFQPHQMLPQNNTLVVKDLTTTGGGVVAAVGGGAVAAVGGAGAGAGGISALGGAGVSGAGAIAALGGAGVSGAGGIAALGGAGVSGAGGIAALGGAGAADNSQNSGESSGKGKKRIIDGPPEVVIERRQRRMLKNRESAARSRARRQAYTVELEAELSVLKDENEKLKKVLAEDERKRKEEISQRKPTTMAQKRTEKKRALKRPLSASCSWLSFQAPTRCSRITSWLWKVTADTDIHHPKAA
ncbi:unnamed protein product [Sphenostylis stenocarpa]|uniref:BZIP domain-containing protein n=1 Tax=Sphenostylis stenocarpa TaxID=92480 RepID=A0AA86SEZ4_9FABA|nr:unnamed protein product [Sphenostylis stenocarpa]